MPTGLRTAGSTLDALERLADAGLCAQELLEEASRRIDRVIESDGYFVGATDPHTSLCLGPGLVRDLPADQCKPTWDYEFLGPDDVLAFRRIARAPSPVACAHEATGGRPDRSARWSEFAAATGFRAEMRVAFTFGGRLYGVGQFDRLGDVSRFTPEHRAWLERAAPVVGRGLRRALLEGTSRAALCRGPGILVVDPAGRIVSATPEADAWLAEMEPWTDAVVTAAPELPMAAHAHIAAARAAAAWPGECSVPPARLRTRRGVWLVLHASMLQGTDDLALVIEPAQAGNVAPLIVEAYELTPRELEVAGAIARGLGTGEIASLLIVSPHTVRHHVKAIFEKVGVSSRGELVAKLFADHYAPVSAHG